MSVKYDRTIMEFSLKTKATIIQSWASSYESIIISTLYDSSKTFIVTRSHSRIDSNAVKTNKQMITTLGHYSKYNLENSYFKLKDKKYTRGYID